MKIIASAVAGLITCHIALILAVGAALPWAGVLACGQPADYQAEPGIRPYAPAPLTASLN